jgi:deferrochelatase/peroxidase EfeB
MDIVSAPATVSLELDDLQSGVLHPRPSPYVGTYLLLRIDDPAAGRALVRRLIPLVGSGRVPSEPPWVTVAFTYSGLQALGVPQESLDSFAPEFQQGMAARAVELGDVGDSAPGNWEPPLGSSDVWRPSRSRRAAPTPSSPGSS